MLRRKWSLPLALALLIGCTDPIEPNDPPNTQFPEDCPIGQRWNPVAGACEDSSMVGDMPGGVNNPAACASNAQCPGTETCVDGACTNAPPQK